ncbi:MAG: DNA alkylation repair protein [Armatimonadota bacterium]|nr:DNA alkylation repair protein [Armatimonadota bacterium]
MQSCKGLSATLTRKAKHSNWSDTVCSLELALIATATKERAQYEKKYLKSDLRFIGANAADVHRQVKGFYLDHKSISRTEMFELTKALWATDCHELRSIAIGLLVRYSNHTDARDLPLFRRWIMESAGWAHVDWISTDVLGSLYSRFPEIAITLKIWSKDKDFWVRRASILTLLDEARHGNEKAFELFSELASPMIGEKEFFIRKAIGWILREVSKGQPTWTLKFLQRHAAQASGLTFREGSKYLSESQRRLLESERDVKK